MEGKLLIKKESLALCMWDLILLKSNDPANSLVLGLTSEHGFPGMLIEIAFPSSVMPVKGHLRLRNHVMTHAHVSYRQCVQLVVGRRRSSAFNGFHQPDINGEMK